MLLRLLINSAKPYILHIIVIVVLQAAQTTASLYLPTVNAEIINNGIIKGDIEYIWQHGGLMLVIATIQVLCAAAATFFSAMVAMAIGRDLRGRLFTHIESLSIKEFSQFGASSLITRNTNDIKQIQDLVTTIFVFMVSAPILCVGAIVLALQQDVELSKILWVVMPLVVAVMTVFMFYLVPRFRRMQDRIDDVNTVLREQIIGVAVIRAFAKDKAESARFDAINSRLANTNLSVGRGFSFMFPSFMLIINLASVAVIWFGASRIEGGEMEIGALTALLTYIIQVMMGILMAMFMLMMVPRAAVSAERITAVLNAEGSVREKPNADAFIPGAGTLTFKNVSYKYPGAENDVIKNLSFTANSGETTAIIGSTGAGKTTIFNLIPRLIDPTSGQILIDDRPINDMTLKSLRSAVAAVPQKAFLFRGTIASNLQVAAPNASPEQMWQALEVAEAAKFVRETGEGLNFVVEAGGSNLSGGQRQRLCIARAVMAGAAINLFDDSFSALDYTTDAKIRAALAPLTQNTTTIIVAQRVSSIMAAEKILVLEEGRLVGEGTHQQLLETCAPYQEIVASQMSLEEAS